ncbi:MAG: hypothetical protein D6728_12295 [Cyanobacteria bacterium J055]|nr:MAG: hypothetical protein D6728_12295 [Cyanobacteria bacterium J055]
MTQRSIFEGGRHHPPDFKIGGLTPLPGLSGNGEILQRFVEIVVWTTNFQRKITKIFDREGSSFPDARIQV